MSKAKIKTTKDGFNLVEGTVGVILDSIWHNESEQILKIKFATGKTLIHKPIENDLITIHEVPINRDGARNLG